jgi:hypothetical protein
MISCHPSEHQINASARHQEAKSIQALTQLLNVKIPHAFGFEQPTATNLAPRDNLTATLRKLKQGPCATKYQPPCPTSLQSGGAIFCV